MITLAYIIFGAVVLAVLILNFIIVRYFNHSTESEALPTFISVITLTLALLCVCLTPVDIYSVSIPNLPQEFFSTIKILYYVLYGSVLGIAFCLVPFAYFWYEAFDPENSSGLRRFGNTMKFTGGFMLVILALIITGLFIRGANDGGAGTFQGWVEKILNTENQGEGALLFSIACLTILGYIMWISYCAYGLSALPVNMIKGKRGVREERREYASESSRTEDKKRLLDDQEGTHDDRLDRTTTALSKRAKRLEEAATGCCSKIGTVLRPFSIIFGIFFLLVSFLIVGSVGLSALDRTLNSYCGAACGFITKNPMWFNPLDNLLVVMSTIFPADFVMIGLIILYIYFATLTGITRIGIRFLWIKLYSFRAHGTLPQGWLIASCVLMLTVLALNMQLTMIAPKYANFGSQTWKNETMNKTESCSIEGMHYGNCKMTQIGQIVSKILLKGGFFGFTFYAISWGFILFYLIGLLVASCKKADSNIEQYSDDEYEDEDDDGKTSSSRRRV